MNPPSRAASQEDLWALWSLCLTSLEKYFSETPPDRVSAAYLNTARQFLKDNGIAIDALALADVRRGVEELRALSLPFTEKKN
jgi:hypothetical protein